MKGKRVVIHDRRFMWWDGKKLTPVRLSEKARAHLSQVKSVVARGTPTPENFKALADRSNEELAQRLGADRETVQRWRRDTVTHRFRGSRALPVPGEYDETLNLSQLARACGWDSPCRFSTALRKHRPEIHATAVANGMSRSKAALKKKEGK